MSTGECKVLADRLRHLFFQRADLSQLNEAVDRALGNYTDYYSNTVGKYEALERLFGRIDFSETRALATAFIEQRRNSMPAPPREYLIEFENWLTESARVAEGPVATSAAQLAGVPRELTELLDRTLQIDQFREWLSRHMAESGSDARLAVVCGCPRSAPREAVQRMLSLREGLRGLIASPGDFVWAQVTRDLHPSRVRLAVEDAVVGKFEGFGDTMAALRSGLESAGRKFALLAVEVRFREVELTSARKSLFAEFVDACSSLGCGAFPSVLAVASVKLDGSTQRQSFLSRLAAAFGRSFEFRQHAVRPLVDSGQAIELFLDDVTRTDVENWASRPDVEKCLVRVPGFRIREAMLDDLFKGRPRAPMEEIADSLCKMLKV